MSNDSALSPVEHITMEDQESDDFVSTFPASQMEEFFPLTEEATAAPSISAAPSTTIAPPISPSSSQASRIPSKSPLFGSQKYKELKSIRQHVSELLPGYQVVPQLPEKWTVEGAARWKVENNITDKAYSDMLPSTAPSLSTVRRFLDKLATNLANARKDGLANAILNYLNSMPKYVREKK